MRCKVAWDDDEMGTTIIGKLLEWCHAIGWLAIYECIYIIICIYIDTWHICLCYHEIMDC